MRALSLWQPWASAIAAGAKKIETRGWSTPYRGPLAIHAARRWTGVERATWASWRLAWPARFPAGLPPPLGAVVAVAELVACVSTEDLAPGLTTLEGQMGNYAAGRFGWVLRDVARLERPLPLRGRQGLWGLSEAEAECVRAALLPLPITAAQIDKLEHALGLDYWHAHATGASTCMRPGIAPPEAR